MFLLFYCVYSEHVITLIIPYQISLIGELQAFNTHALAQQTMIVATFVCGSSRFYISLYRYNYIVLGAMYRLA